MNISRGNISKNELQELDAETISLPVFVLDDTSSETLLEEAIEVLKKSKILGFDTETKPAFKKGIKHKVCLLQLATHQEVYLFRLHKLKSRCALNQLLNFLDNPKQFKVGVGIAEDIKELKRDYDIRVSSACDLRSISQPAKIEVESLAKIYAILFGKRLSKAQRVSDWERDNLSKAQISYAALDAFAGLRIFDELMEFFKDDFLFSTGDIAKNTAQQKRKKLKKQFRKKKKDTTKFSMKKVSKVI